jgi:hypothetical protein
MVQKRFWFILVSKRSPGRQQGIHCIDCVSTYGPSCVCVFQLEDIRVLRLILPEDECLRLWRCWNCFEEMFNSRFVLCRLSSFEDCRGIEPTLMMRFVFPPHLRNLNVIGDKVYSTRSICKPGMPLAKPGFQMSGEPTKVCDAKCL